MLHNKTRYIVQYRSNMFPGVWVDINEGDFSSKDMAQWTMNGHKKDLNLGDIDYRLVKREYFYQEEVIP